MADVIRLTRFEDGPVWVRGEEIAASMLNTVAYAGDTRLVYLRGGSWFGVQDTPENAALIQSAMSVPDATRQA